MSFWKKLFGSSRSEPTPSRPATTPQAASPDKLNKQRSLFVEFLADINDIIRKLFTGASTEDTARANDVLQDVNKLLPGNVHFVIALAAAAQLHNALKEYTGKSHPSVVQFVEEGQAGPQGLGTGTIALMDRISDVMEAKEANWFIAAAVSAFLLRSAIQGMIDDINASLATQ